MAPKKPTPKKTTRVSPSARGEGSRPKPVAKRVSPSVRGEGVRSDKPTKIVESGLGNLPMAVAKLAMAIAKQAPKSKPTIAKGQIKRTAPKSNVKVIPKGTKIKKIAPAGKTPAEAARYKGLAEQRAKLLKKK